MNQIMVAFAGERTRQRMTEILESSGISVAVSCGTGAEVLGRAGRMSGGVVLCGNELYDMMADELYEDLPKGFSMLLLAAGAQLEDRAHPEIATLKAPVERTALVNAVQSMLRKSEDPKPAVPRRSEEDRRIIQQAKTVLMELGGMTEEQAHRFLQKRSMDAGAKMVQTARKVLEGQMAVS